MVLSVVGVFCSITRTNTICMIAVACLWYLMYIKNGKVKRTTVTKFISVLVIIILLIIAYIGLFDISIENNASSLNALFNSLFNIGEDTRFTGRITRWMLAINFIKKHLLIGYGVGAAADTMEMYHISKVFVTSHNMFLKIWMELGLLGLFFYISVFFNVLKKVRQLFVHDYIYRSLFYTMLSSVFINGLVGSTIGSFPSMTLFWIVCGTLLAANQSQLPNLIKY